MVRSDADSTRYSSSAVFPIPASPRRTSDRLSPRRMSRSIPPAGRTRRPARGGSCASGSPGPVLRRAQLGKTHRPSLPGSTGAGQSSLQTRELDQGPRRARLADEESRLGGVTKRPRKEILMSQSPALPSVPEGPGSVSGAPNLPAGFADTFTSRYIDTGGLRLHAVIGGDGPPLLLVHGWPETWYAWRLVMPALARDFKVIAVDQRGIGLSDKPADGYDTGTLAADLVALMDALGHERFAVVGHDTGFAISYALAADHPERVDRVALAEIPGPPGRGALAARCSSPRRSTTGCGTSRSTGSRSSPSSSSRDARTSSSATSSPSRAGRLPAERHRLLRRPRLQSRRRCAAASGSTGRSTRPSRRTRSAQAGRSRCPSSRSAERRATASTSARR